MPKRHRNQTLPDIVPNSDFQAYQDEQDFASQSNVKFRTSQPIPAFTKERPGEAWQDEQSKAKDRDGCHEAHDERL